MKSTFKSLIPGLLIIGVILLSISFQSCATIKAAFQTEPEKVEMVLLSELNFKGETAGIKGPAIFGDFTVTHYIGNAIPIKDMAMLEWLPYPKEKQILFILWAKAECPEGVALQTYNLNTKEYTFWIYDSKGQAWQVDEEKYDYFLELEHPCAEKMSGDADAILTL